MGTLAAGAASVEITPVDSQFLFGYPHVERYSAGVHDPLVSSALYLSDGRTAAMFVANDIVYVGKASAERVRRRIAEAVPVPAANIMVTATHTHSGPITLDCLSCEADKVVPPADPKYVRRMEDGIVEAALAAYRNAEPAAAGMAVADGTGVGTNRRDPSGPADREVPVLLVKSADGRRNIACMLVCSMHPTVLHEDSKLVSADFPGAAKRYLRERVLGRDCVVVYHTGPEGNQSPRHVTRGNTFEEADRLGGILGRAIEKVVPAIECRSDLTIKCVRGFVELPRRTFPAVADAQAKLDRAVKRLAELRARGADRADVRTAECDWFGAEETLTFAHAGAEGRVAAAQSACMPSEVQVISVGPWRFAGWPGEMFIEYALDVKARRPGTYVIALANGELQGYIVTEEAAAEGGYEASNGLFTPASGRLLVQKTLELTEG